MSTPDEDVEALLFAKAKEYTALDLAFPNDGYEPNPDVAYVKVDHFRAGLNTYDLGGECSYAKGFLQMCIYAPRGKGANEARARAGAIVDLWWTPHFLTLTKNGIRVKVSKRPVLGTGYNDVTSYLLPVSIYYEVFL